MLSRILFCYLDFIKVVELFSNTAPLIVKMTFKKYVIVGK